MQIGSLVAPALLRGSASMRDLCLKKRDGAEQQFGAETQPRPPALDLGSQHRTRGLWYGR